MCHPGGRKSNKTESVLKLQYMAQEKSFPTQLAPVTIVRWCLLLTAETVDLLNRPRWHFLHRIAKFLQTVTVHRHFFRTLLITGLPEPIFTTIYSALFWRKDAKSLREGWWWPCLRDLYVCRGEEGRIRKGVTVSPLKYANADTSCSRKMGEEFAYRDCFLFFIQNLP